MRLTLLACGIALTLASPAAATGLYTCDSGSQESWKSEERLKERLTEKGWSVRRVKEDGGCWEVYALDPNGQRVEAYFHPVTLENVFTSTR